MTDVLYLIDGNALIYRAYYAFIRRPLITTKGENTSAIFGFMKMILKLIKDENIKYMACIFDSKVKTFRHKMYPHYKEKRLKAPEDLHLQAEIVKELVEKLGLYRVEVEQYEADDIIGTFAAKASASGMKSIIVSGDKDVLQLVDDNVIVYANKKGISEIDVMDRKKVKEVWGIVPEHIVDLLSLMGDQSDNIPGVKGIGKVAAVKLVNKYGSIENLYKNIDTLDNQRTKTLLVDGKQDAFLSKELLILKMDVPVDFRKENYKISDFPKAEGIDLLNEKELNSIVIELIGSKFREGKKDIKRGEYVLIDTEKVFKDLEERIYKIGLISFDTESTGTDPINSEVIGISISVEEQEGYYIPILTKTGRALGVDFLKGELKKVLEDEKIKKIGQNIKYDYVILLKYGISMKGIIGDTMIASYLLNPQKRRYSIDDLAKEYLDYDTIHYSDIVKNSKETLLDYPVEKIVEYACEDSDIVLRLFKIFEKKLKERGIIELYRDIEIPLLVILGKMENNGVRIDADYLKSMSKEFEKEIAEIEREIISIAGVEFNVRSTKQLSYVLFEKMKLPLIKKTKTGISTDESVLEELSYTYDIAKLLLRFRTLSKLKSTYIDSLPNMVNKRTGKIHTSFNQTITTTGRLSSTYPNLQNIPIRNKEGRAIRKAFIPEEGFLFVSADYSQIELRILASLSKDEVLVNTFMKDGDIHRETAAMLFNIPVEDVKDYQRQVAKTINFSIIYGISPFGLSKRLGISRKDASGFIDIYFLKYKRVKKYFEDVVERAKKDGYVETILGRRRYVPEIRSGNRNLYESAKRIAINMPIQGAAADLIKKAMVIIDGELENKKLKSRMLIQVHDELVFESPEDEYDILKNIVKDKMENAIEFDVPIKVNIKAGRNWEEAH